MKRLSIGILIGCLCLSGAAHAQPPVFDCDATLRRGMPPMRFQVYATGEMDSEDMPIYRMEITAGDGTQLPSLTFPSREGTDGLALLLRFVDINLDGYQDVEATRAMGASNLYSSYFLYDPAANAFELCPALDCLSNYALYPGQRLIFNHEQDGIATGIYSLFVINEEKPVLFRRASILFDQGDDGTSAIRARVVEYGLDGSEAVLLDESHPPTEDEADDQARYVRCMQLLWSGADPGEPPLPIILYPCADSDGHGAYHADPACPAIPANQLPSLESVRRSDLNTAALADFKPCAQCLVQE